jgi:hypothetical protein
LVGEEVTPTSEALNLTIPLYLQDLGEIYQEEGPTGVITSAIPAFFGIGVQSYGGNSGLKNKEFDPKDEIQTTNQEHEYSFSKPGRKQLENSFGEKVSNAVYDEYYRLRDQKVASLFKANKHRLQRVKDDAIYDRMMDNITREADRAAKYKIARDNDWDTEKFQSRSIFRLKNYKKDRDGKVVEGF